MASRSGGTRPRLIKIPQRTCVACRQTNAKRQLVRVVRAPDGSVTIDPSGKRSGRGAYLCSSAECWQAGLNRGVLPRALKIESIPEEDLRGLTEFAQALEQGQ
jgi:predicted RNA-binding protein YlxR (DUF448 family)